MFQFALQKKLLHNFLLIALGCDQIFYIIFGRLTGALFPEVTSDYPNLMPDTRMTGRGIIAIWWPPKWLTRFVLSLSHVYLQRSPDYV